MSLCVYVCARVRALELDFADCGAVVAHRLSGILLTESKWIYGELRKGSPVEKKKLILVEQERNNVTTVCHKIKVRA